MENVEFNKKYAKLTFLKQKPISNALLRAENTDDTRYVYREGITHLLAG
jgi:hypothetical protein